MSAARSDRTPASTAAGAAPLLVTALLIASCASDPPAAAPAGGLTGTLTAVSDMQGIADSPIGSSSTVAVSIIAVPADAVGGLWQAAGVQPVAPRDLAHLAEPLPIDAVAASDGSTAPVDSHGRFTLDVAPGDHLLCFTDAVVTRGCAMVALPESGVLRAGWGEAGFTVTLDD